MILILFGVALGVALNQIRGLQKRVDDLEEFIGKTFLDEDEQLLKTICVYCLHNLKKREMKKIDWKKVKIMAALYTMATIALMAFLALYEFVEYLTCVSC